jgi:ribosomal-protein-alanine N-acetyltransferase
MLSPADAIIETERVVLRALRKSDLDDLSRLYADPEVRRYFPEGTLDRAATEAELDWFIAGGDPAHPGLVLRAVIHKASGRFIGRAGLLGWTIEESPEVEIAYLIGRDLWGQGLGTEIARALVAHGTQALGHARLIALVDPANTASIRVAEKAGLPFEREVMLEGFRTRIHALRPS